jgi:hypothetical protein
MIETVDSKKLASILDKAWTNPEKLRVLVQVNTSGEDCNSPSSHLFLTRFLPFLKMHPSTPSLLFFFFSLTHSLSAKSGVEPTEAFGLVEYLTI